MRKLATLLSLALTLALPASSLAASTSGSTAESFSIASTISATFPTSISYTGSVSSVSSPLVHVSNLATTNPSGLNVTVSVSDLTSGPNTITGSKRTSTTPSGTGGMTGSAPGTFAVGVPVVMGTSSGAISGGDLAMTFSIDTTGAVPGAYTGTLAWVASTNP